MTGGLGGRVLGEIPVVLGERLAVFVGGTAKSVNGGSSGRGGGGGGGGGGSSYIERSARKSETWKGWKTATGNGLVIFSW
ncbi:MAG TPA: hypothetical protein VKR56_07950 [Candidatus Cybelea sp.]|nr:hypothetical protein [Candidatus Cybelea sp.]